MKKKKKLHIDINSIITLILIIISIIAVIFVIEKVVLKKDLPSILGFKVLQVASGSMSGTLEVNDLILVKEYNSEADVAVGDIITLKQGDSFITHRIVETNKTTTEMLYITKGDANGSKDIEPVEYEEIYGKYIFTIPLLGKVMAFMQNSVGMTIVFTVPILLIVIELLKERKRQMLSNRRKEKRLRYEYEKMLKEQSQRQEKGDFV